MWESAYPLQLNQGGSAFVYPPAQCFLGISDGFSGSIFKHGSCYRRSSWVDRKKTLGSDKCAERPSRWRNTLEETHESSCLHQQPGMSAMRYFKIKVRMQLWDLLLDLLRSLWASESSPRDSDFSILVSGGCFFYRLHVNCAAGKILVYQNHITNCNHMIGNAIPLQRLEQENTFKDKLILKDISALWITSCALLWVNYRAWKGEVYILYFRVPDVCINSSE